MVSFVWNRERERERERERDGMCMLSERYGVTGCVQVPEKRDREE